MLCDHCGEETTRGAFFCSGCGRPLGFKRDAEAQETGLEDLADVPPPESSREDGTVAGTMGERKEGVNISRKGVNLRRDGGLRRGTGSVRNVPHRQRYASVYRACSGEPAGGRLPRSCSQSAGRDADLLTEQS